MRRCSDERGDVILHGLLRLVAGLLVLGLVAFEGGALLVNHAQLDETARQAARVGARAWASERSPAAVEAAVLRHLDGLDDVTLDRVAVDHDRVSVTVTRAAAVLLLDRIGPVSRHAQGRATASWAAGPT